VAIRKQITMVTHSCLERITIVLIFNVAVNIRLLKIFFNYCALAMIVLAAENEPAFILMTNTPVVFTF